MPATSYEHLRALVVEDNPHMRALLRSLLYALGIKNVSEAADGTSGFDELRRSQVDLVLTDLTMAPTDGIEFTKRVRSDNASPNPYVPIIMVTGHTERLRVEAARDAGVTEFLAKPITVHNLMSRLAEIVDRPRAFVKCESYFGPDRRRRRNNDYSGPWRRNDDLANDIEVREA